jgi:hypothetical protein
MSASWIILEIVTAVIISFKTFRYYHHNVRCGPPAGSLGVVLTTPYRIKVSFLRNVTKVFGPG